MRILRDLLQLSKARLSGLVVATASVGYLLAATPFDAAVLAATLVGTTLTAWGANALNQYRERDVDALMLRTRERPLPAGRLAPATALLYGVGTSLFGTFVLLAFTGPLPASLAALTILLYVLVYTPLKRRTTLNTLVGAVCGAIPPMIGWTAATGRLQVGAWLLFALLFVWQMPHFLALAWLYREDYARGGLRMLPVIDPTGGLTFPVTVLFAVLHLPLGLLVSVAGVSGPWFALGSLGLGACWVWLAFRLYVRRSETAARRVFLASLAYLPLALLLMVADRGPGWSARSLPTAATALVGAAAGAGSGSAAPAALREGRP